MVYFFYGADTFRLKQKINSVSAQYKAKHKSGLNFDRFDFLQAESFDRLKAFLDAYSMFDEKKLALVENLLGSTAEVQKSVVGYLEKNALKNPDIFVMIAQELKLNEERKKTGKYVLGKKEAEDFFKKLVAKAEGSEEFDLLVGAKLENWIKKEVEKNNGRAESEAVKKLALFVGSDLWQMQSEISKLLSYKNGEPITEKDVDVLVGAKSTSDIFGAVDALSLRQKNSAFKLLHRQLAQGESEIYLLSRLISQFRNLLLIKEQLERGVPFCQLDKKLKLHPFVLRKCCEQAKNFSLPVLKKIYERLQETDLAIKGGRAEPQTALDLIIEEITG